MRVFVTGATGMLGGALVRRLAADGHEVRVLVRKGNTDLPASAVQGDLASEDAMRRGMEGCAAVFHVAGAISYQARDTDELVRTNVDGTRCVLAAALAAKVKRVVHTSSTAAVGLSDCPDAVLTEDAPFEERFHAVPYMWTKHEAEGEVARAVAAGLDVVMVNPSTILGAGDSRLNTGRVFQQSAKGALRAAPPGGNSFVALRDVVDAHLLALDKGRTGRRYIVSTENLTNAAYLSLLAKLFGRPPVTRVLPRWAGAPLGAVARLGIGGLSPQIVFFAWRFRWFSAARAASELGWTPRVTISDAAAEARAFYESIGALSRAA